MITFRANQPVLFVLFTVIYFYLIVLQMAVLFKACHLAYCDIVKYCILFCFNVAKVSEVISRFNSVHGV